SSGGKSGLRAPSVGRVAVKLDHRRGCVAGERSCELTVVGWRHWGIVPGAAVGRPPQRARGDAIWVARFDGNDHGFTALRNSRLMMEIVERRAEVRLVARILCAGRAVESRDIQQRQLCQAIEVKPGVQLIR